MSRSAISISLPDEVLEIVDEFRGEKFLKRSPAIVQIILEWQEMKGAEEKGENKNEH
jgi:metal-responsive CopG/Arc/MetJ family transcriptional regulator